MSELVAQLLAELIAGFMPLEEPQEIHLSKDQGAWRVIHIPVHYEPGEEDWEYIKITENGRTRIAPF